MADDEDSLDFERPDPVLGGMPLSAEDEEEIQQRTRNSILLSVAKIAETQARKQGENSIPAGKEAVMVISEMVFKHLESLAGDIRLFARHAGRKCVNAEDVKLCARKNPSLARTLEEFEEELDRQAGAKKKRKTVPQTDKSAAPKAVKKRLRVGEDEDEDDAP